MQSNLDPVWQLLPPITATGQEQMAIDRWLLDRHSKGKSLATLRFYTWSPAAISLGYHQNSYPQTWDDLRWHDRKIQIVKRPTGGRGVLHQGDLTYAIICSGLDGKRREIYRYLCQFLIDGFSNLGVSLTYGNCDRQYIGNPNCFALATGADLVCDDGYKLIGSSQVIRNRVILQHGSIRIDPDPQLFEQVFGTKPQLPSDLIRNLTIPNLIECLTESARQWLKIEFETRSLSESDRIEIATNFM
jgi:lipoate---protein ligase